MWALVTGASSGIGRDMARYLYSLGYNLILVARDKERMEELRTELYTKNGQEEKHNRNNKDDQKSNNKDKKTEKKDLEAKKEILIYSIDLSKKEECIKLYENTKNIEIDLLINNAGFGTFGEFPKTDLEKEVNLINTNITAVHILTKLYLQDMIKRNKVQILNVASIAGMEPGPLMAAYYASKAYVIRLSRAINKELKKAKSNVKISILCPGPVDTNFNNVANVVFKTPSMPSEKVAKYAIDKTLKGKLIIIPGILNKSVRFFSKVLPDAVLEECAYHIQRKKKK